MELNKKMEIIEERTNKVATEFKDILNKLNFIPKEAHELTTNQIDILTNTNDILKTLEENLYFNNEERK